MTDRQVKVVASVQATNYLSGMDQMARKTKDVTKAAEEQSAALKNLGQTGGIALAAIGVAAAGVATLAIAKFAEFDQAMSFVAATGKDAKDNQDALRDAAIAAGAATVFSATESANAIEEMAKAGVEAKDILAGGLTGALNLAAAGGLGVADAAGIAGTALKQFALDGKDMNHVADLLSAGAGKAMGSVEDLSQGLKFVGPVAHGMGVSIDETVGVLAEFASQGILADQAGTGLRGMLSSLTSPSKTAGTELETLGVHLYDSQGKFLGLANMAGELEKAYKGMSDQEKDTSLGMIFGNQQITAARIVLDQGRAGVEQWTDSVNDQGFAARTAAERLNNLRGDVEQLGGAFDTALIKMGSGADGVLRELVQTATDAVTVFGELPAWVQGTTFVVIALTAAVGLLGGGFLLLLPKILETGAALTVLSASTIPGVAATATGLLVTVRAVGVGLMATARFLMGPWGIALGVAAISVAALSKTMSSGAPDAEAMANALEHTTEAAKLLREASKQDSASKFFWGNYADSLKDLPGLLDKINNDGWDFFNLTFQQQGAVDGIKRLGSALGDLAGKDLPAAQSQFRGLAEQYHLTRDQQLKILDTMEPYKAALIAQANQIGINVTTGSKAENQALLLKLAFGSAEQATEDNSEALAEMSDKANDAQGDISDLAKAITDFGKGQIDVNAAQRDFQAAIDDLTKSVHDNGTTLDIGTEKGRANQSALDDIAKSALGAASAILTQTGNQEDATKAVADGRAALIESLKQFGITGQAAEDYANKLGLIPDHVKTTAELQTEAATRDLNAWLAANANHRVHVQAIVDGRPTGSGLTFADGGPIPGTPSHTDNMLIAAASGEYMVRTRQAQIPENRRALEFMNAGGVIPGYATGGMVGFQPAPVYTPAPPRQYMPGPGPSQSPQFNVVVKSKGGIDLLRYVDVSIESAFDADGQVQERGYRG